MQVKTLPELLLERLSKAPDQSFFWVRRGEQWQSFRYEEVFGCIVDVARQLEKLGVQKNQVVAIMASTGMDWEVIHLALLLLGAVVVGLDPAEMPEQLGEIIRIAEVRHLVVDRCERLEKFADVDKDKFQSLITIEKNFTSSEKIRGVVIEFGRDNSIDPELLSITSQSSPKDIATIIFTSGTTGKPKGIAYRHEQVMAALEAILHAYPELSDKSCRLVCWLPLSNLFQRIVNLCALASGAEIYFVESPQKIIEYLPQISPHIFIAVPRFYEKLYQEFHRKLSEQPKLLGIVLLCFLYLGERPNYVGKIFRKLNSQLFGAFRSLFGDQIRFLISGSAPMPIWLLNRYNSIGLLILEAYGLSENVVPIAVNRLKEFRFGTVGKVMVSNHVVLAEDGELLVSGIGVFDGYLGDGVPERKVSNEGYLATGDFAKIDDQGFISLIGRKSEVFKTSTGRKVAPVAIEAFLQSLPEVEHAMIVGENRKYLVALITLGNLSFENNQEVVLCVQSLATKVAAMCKGWADYKKPAGLVVYLGSLQIDRQELTINLKLRRKAVLQNYVESIDELYQALDNPEAAIHLQPIFTGENVVLCKL